MNKKDLQMFCEMSAAFCHVFDVVEQLSPNDLRLKEANAHKERARELFTEIYPEISPDNLISKPLVSKAILDKFNKEHG